ncbi:MAG TPA: DNA polymerase III subunit chi [Steroidobacteraceae bacterium]|nr:DNA polymerase III subunit chi [Steroidobacteraceae bacterium]
MTERVDFYILNSAEPERRWLFACRLAEKAYLQDLSVLIWSDNAADAGRCDDLLWTFADRSFVPHQLDREGEPADVETPVHLTLALESAASADLLINLADRLPEGLARFTRVAEIIDADPERRRLGRERFKAYRESKLELQTHQLNDVAEI